MNSKFLANLYLETSSVCFYAKQLTHYLLKETYSRAAKSTNSRTKPHSLCQALLLQELLLKTMGFVAEFSFCVPRAATNPSFIDSYFTLFLIMVAKTETDGRRVY
jgi:hypothetical protein